MLEKLFDDIRLFQNTKDNLIAFRQELKACSTVPASIVDNSSVFTGLLNDPDPKIRKNAVLILGEIKASSETSEVFSHYLTETTEYNKSAYLKALSGLDYSDYTDRLKERRDELIAADISPDSRKHIIEEMHELNLLLRDGFSAHEFIGSGIVNEIVLLTNRNFKNITMQELKGIPHKEFTAGVMAKTTQLDYIRNNIRTYSELLFVPESIKMCSSEPASAARELIDAGIIDYIFARIDNPDVPVHFRTDYRTKDTKKSADFAHKFSEELEFLSKWKLINSTNNYELEFRFIDTSENRLVILLRFTMLSDNRFSYRANTIAASLKPSTAALLMRLAGTHFIDNAAVLDPFCGCGTMLIEREKYKPSRLYYGIDIFGDAIKASDKNIRLAGIQNKTELINRDFFEFRHVHRFNEIITDMPFVSEHKNERDIEMLYRHFFEKIPALLEPQAKLFIYSRNRDFLRKYALAAHLGIIAEYEISKMEGSYFFILSGK